MSHLNSSLEPNFESFLNVDSDFKPQSASSTPHTGLASSFDAGSQQEVFSGPSFPYDAYRQQTGLPVGGLANTFAINQTSGLNHFDGNNSFVMPDEITHFPLSKIEDFDFARNPTYEMTDVEFEDDSSPDGLPTTMFYPGGSSKDFVSPNNLVAPSKPLPKSLPVKDPAVEESISRILSQMRQKNDTETENSNTSPVPSATLSEEGKKLSSKERRQLRNKVSARAFRSRRKEYMTQLEGDVAAKNDEANALRVENQQLREENNRLTDLTRMLLSSSAFSSFLQELSQSGVPQRPSLPTQPVRQERPQAQPARKDINPHEAARQVHQQQHVGMVLVPENNFDMSLFETPAWTPAVPSNDVHIYAVTTLPEEPVIDVTKLSRKTKSESGPAPSVSKNLPVLAEMPAAVAATTKLVPTTPQRQPEHQIVSNPKHAATLPLNLISKASDEGSWDRLLDMCDALEQSSERNAPSPKRGSHDPARSLSRRRSKSRTMAVPKDSRQSFHLQFVTSPTADTQGTLAVLHFDSQRYIIGRLAEGAQRACIQRGVGIKKLHTAFLTGTTTWKDNGGLLGFVLTLADLQRNAEQGVSTGPGPPIRIHGGPKLMHSVACARRFIFRTGCPLKVHEHQVGDFKWPSEPDFVDENIRVWPIAIAANSQPSSSAGETAADLVKEQQALRSSIVSAMFNSDWRADRLEQRPFESVKLPATIWRRDPETRKLQSTYCTSMKDAPHIKPGDIVSVRQPWPASLVAEIPNASNLPEAVAMSYLVRGHHQRGAFDSKKATALGVPNSAIRKDLINGKAITLQNGTVITPDMVVGAGRPSKGLAFFDLPSVAHVQQLNHLLSANQGMLEDIVAVIWMLGTQVADSEVFKSTIATLSGLDHFITRSDPAGNSLAFESVTASAIRLSEVSSSLFPIPLFDTTEPQDTAPASSRHFPIRPGLQLNLEPRYGQDDSHVPPPMTIDSVERPESEEYLAAKSALGQDAIAYAPALTEPEIVTLGTGSAQPSKYRNVSATLLRMPNDQGNYLLDCGENTMGQLRRLYSPSDLKDILLNLKGIWISHLHADHHLGTISVLHDRTAAFDEYAPDADRSIYLMSEPNMVDYVRDYASVEPFVTQRSGLIPIVCDQNVGPLLDGREYDFSAQKSSAISSVRTVNVSHCQNAQAVAITFKDGFKISYSGDCRPSARFCRIGRASDVLIHEATFDDEMEGDAVAKKHCTISEALGVALRMEAKNVVLTHFSQRYQKLPNLSMTKLPSELAFEEARGNSDAGPIDSTQGGSYFNDDSIITTDKQSAMTLHPDFLDLSAQAHSDSGTRASEDANLIASLSASRAAALERRRAAVATNLAVCVAFDYMRVRVSQIKDCRRLYPAIQAMFAELEQRSEERKATERAAISSNLREKAEQRDKKLNVESAGKKAATTTTTGAGAGAGKKNQGLKRKREHGIEPAAPATHAAPPA
ncbi:hypothetical protein DV738_g3919, partial [Chaetothyriales sp. CBS 135597]